MKRFLLPLLLLALSSCASPSVWQTVREQPPRVIETLPGQYRQLALCIVMMSEADDAKMGFRMLDDPDSQTARLSSGWRPVTEILLIQQPGAHVRIEIRQIQDLYDFIDDRWMQNRDYARRCSNGSK